MFGTILFFLAATEPAIKVEPSKKAPSKLHQQAAEMMQASRSTMIIDPKSRAGDYQKAFDLLRQEKSTSKVVFELADGSKISNVIEMKLMPNDTLIIFRYSTPKGIKFQVVEIENLVSIMHQ